MSGWLRIWRVGAPRMLLTFELLHSRPSYLTINVVRGSATEQHCLEQKVAELGRGKCAEGVGPLGLPLEASAAKASGIEARRAEIGAAAQFTTVR